MWTGSGPRPVALGREPQALVGRVALDSPDDDLGVSFYIGPAHQPIGEKSVAISWAARKASLFYKGRAADDELAKNVVATRTFVTQGRAITDFSDDVEPHAAAVSEPFTEATSHVAIPAPPRRADRPMSAVSSPSSRPGMVAQKLTPDVSPLDRDPAPQPAPLSQPASIRPESGGAFATIVRAAAAVRKLVQLPRSGRLASLLGTLQPDQYRLVTWPVDQPLIVQGSPGTGKTIVATHRAAFLVHPGREDGRPISKVLLVGPTDAYVEHVSTVIKSLGGTNVDVRSLEGLLRTKIGLGSGKLKEGLDSRCDTVWELGYATETAARRLRALAGGVAPTMQRLVEALIDPNERLRLIEGAHVDVVEVVGQLGSWKAVTTDSRFVPLLASIAMAIRPVADADRYDHIIIDEAQDLRPLEWRLLNGFLAPGGTMSIFGDTNQRRSDWTYPSWTSLAEHLEFTDEAGIFAIEELDICYRSTRAILRFAGLLLPRGQQNTGVIRDGDKPVVTRVNESSIAKTVVKDAEMLAGRHPGGLTAVICMQPKKVSDAFRILGWGRGDLQESWQHHGCTIQVLHPGRARGLEFDAVVVVEPSDFPTNVGRLGSLYTSLTRATKELHVLHSNALPEGLRDAVRRRLACAGSGSGESATPLRPSPKSQDAFVS